MNVVQRNFIKLLSAGTFGDNSDELLEMMSPYKWRQLFQLSMVHGVVALVYDGINKCKDKFRLQMPEDLKFSWKKAVAEIEETNRHKNTKLAQLYEQMTHNRLRPILFKGQSMAVLYPNGEHRTSGDIDIYFPYESQAKTAEDWLYDNSSSYEPRANEIIKFIWQDMPVEFHNEMEHLTNPLLNRKLQNIIDKEIRCCDSYYIMINGTRIEGVPPTLNLLLILTRIVTFMLNEGVSMKQLVDLGMFLRSIGDKVDYVLLQSQIKKLGMRETVNIIGSMMIELLRFDADELPFMTNTPQKLDTQILNEIFLIERHHSEDWFFTQGNNIFVYNNNSSAMIWHIKHNARLFKYYPTEVFTNFFASFAHSLSHIEE